MQAVGRLRTLKIIINIIYFILLLFLEDEIRVVFKEAQYWVGVLVELCAPNACHPVGCGVGCVAKCTACTAARWAARGSVPRICW